MVEGVRGTVPIRMDLSVRFDYGLSIPWVSRVGAGNLLTATAGPDSVALWTRMDVHGEGLTSVSEFSITRGPADPVHADVVPLARGPAPPDRPVVHDHDDRRLVADVVGRVHLRGRVRRRGPAVADHAEGAHLRADRRHRRRRDDVAARVARREPQLGLPVLLAARRDPDAGVADAWRVPRGGAWPGATGCCGRRPATRRSCRSCTARPASGGSTSGRSTGSRATKGRRRSGSATPRPTNSSSTSTAR